MIDMKRSVEKANSALLAPEMQIEQMNLSTNKSAEQAMYPSMLA